MDSQGESSIAEFDDTNGSITTGSPPPVPVVFADLIAVVLVAGLTLGFALVYGEQGELSVLRVPLGFLFVFLLPGYVLTAALFPRRNVQGGTAGGTTLTGAERLVLSVGLSIMLVPLVSIGLTLISYPISQESVLVSLGAFTFGGSVVTAIRRFRLPTDERFYVPVVDSFATGIDYASANPLNLILVLTIMISAGGFGAAIVTSDDTTGFTELALLGEDSDGEPVVGEYPSELTLGEQEPLYVELSNNEQQTVEYTVVVVLDEFDESGQRVASTELDRFTLELDHGERTVYQHNVEPTLVGENLRLSYLLYMDGVPSEPTPSNAYRSTHIPLSVSEEGS